ncbi:MAG: galactokinase family protein [Pseudomonadota bacterium]
MNRRDRLIARARQGYRITYPCEGPDPRRFFAAPGRATLVGDFVEAQQGFVLSCAIDRETVVALSAGPEIGGRGYVEVVAIDEGRAMDKIALYEPVIQAKDPWKNLVRGVVAALQQRGHCVLPARLSIAGDVPIRTDLASSSSFTVAVALALTQISRISISPGEMALVAWEAENDFLGSTCALTDPMVSVSATRGAALLLDCRSFEHMPIAVSADLAMVVIDSGVRPEVVRSTLAKRRAEADMAAKALGVETLRDVSPETLEANKDAMTPDAYARARHVVDEIARVEPMAVALAHGDTAALAETMRASHASLRDCYVVTVPMIDRLVDVVAHSLEAGGVPLGGVRMTGTSVSGQVIAVVQKDAVETVIDAVETTYNPQADAPASATVYTMTGGAREITPT